MGRGSGTEPLGRLTPGAARPAGAAGERAAAQAARCAPGERWARRDRPERSTVLEPRPGSVADVVPTQRQRRDAAVRSRGDHMAGSSVGAPGEGRPNGGRERARLYFPGYGPRLSQPFRRLERPRASAHPATGRRGEPARAGARGALRRGDPGADRRDPGGDPRSGRTGRAVRGRAPPSRARAPPRVPEGAPAQGEGAPPGGPRRGLGRGLRGRPRGDAADARDAPLRRPAHRRDRAPPGQDRRDADRRGQDPRRTDGRDPQQPVRARRPRRHGQRLPRPARPAVDGSRLPLPRRQRRDDHPRRELRLRAGLSHDRRAPRQPPAGDPPGGLRRRRHLRHQQRVRLRLPARQHGHRARPAGPARPLLRHRRRGRQHPHRRGADAAHHQRPGRGVGRQVLHVRPARAPSPGPAGGRRGGRRLLRRPQGPRRLPDRGRHRQDGELARRREHVRRRSDAGPPLRAGAQGPRAVQARPRLHRQGRRDRHRRRVHRPPDARAGAGARASTRPSRPRRACGSSASR